MSCVIVRNTIHKFLSGIGSLEQLWHWEQHSGQQNDDNTNDSYNSNNLKNMKHRLMYGSSWFRNSFDKSSKDKINKTTTATGGTQLGEWHKRFPNKDKNATTTVVFTKFVSSNPSNASFARSVEESLGHLQCLFDVRNPSDCRLTDALYVFITRAALDGNATASPY